jgi:hypothetical protein
MLWLFVSAEKVKPDIVIKNNQMKILNKIFGIDKKKPVLVVNKQGIHRIGGKPMKDISIPEFEHSPVIYLGLISNHENEMSLLDFDFHMMCPIFIDLSEPIFFDYSDSKNPKIIYENVETNFYPYFEDIPNSAYIEYQETNFSFERLNPTKTKIGVHNVDYIPGEIGTFGKPIWLRDEKWPICPTNGKEMTFLFQLGDVDESKTLKGQKILEKEFIKLYLNFGGDLYVFYEPESKTVAYMIQYL